MSSEIARMLGALARMNGADRSAILARLTPHEREQLTAHAAKATANPTPARRQKERKAALPACSPWLAKRLGVLLDSPDAATTEAARDAVRIAVINLVGARAQ